MPWTARISRSQSSNSSSPGMSIPSSSSPDQRAAGSSRRSIHRSSPHSRTLRDVVSNNGRSNPDSAWRRLDNSRRRLLCACCNSRDPHNRLWSQLRDRSRLGAVASMPSSATAFLLAISILALSGASKRNAPIRLNRYIDHHPDETSDPNPNGIRLRKFTSAPLHRGIDRRQGQFSPSADFFTLFERMASASRTPECLNRFQAVRRIKSSQRDWRSAGGLSQSDRSRVRDPRVDRSDTQGGRRRGRGDPAFA